VQVDELAEELEELDAQEAAVAASGGVDDPARRVGAGSRNELGAGASRTGWRSASSLRHTNLGNVEARPERKALAAVSSPLVETVEDGALRWQDAMSGAPIEVTRKTIQPPMRRRKVVRSPSPAHADFQLRLRSYRDMVSAALSRSWRLDRR
jgi:hypothetical protein